MVYQRDPEFCSLLGIQELSSKNLEILRTAISELISLNGKFLSKSDQWVNGSNKKKLYPVVIAVWKAEEIAFPLSIDPNPDAEKNIAQQQLFQKMEL